MQIKHIHIKDTFPYIDFDTRKYLKKDEKSKLSDKFKKYNFIFGYNGSGKTSLVKILKYLWKQSLIWQNFEDNNSWYYPKSFANIASNVNFFDNLWNSIDHSQLAKKL